MKCRICGNEKGNPIYEAREMMFGYRDAFRYFQCSTCDELQLADFPPSMDKYYPGNYYSYQPVLHRNKVGKRVIGLRNRYAVFGRGILGKLLFAKYPREDLRCLRFLSVKEDTRILDVGCGGGAFLYSLHELGMKNLLGVDPYNAHPVEYGKGLRVLKKEIHDVGGPWDIVMFHHSFEHIPDPVKTLDAVSQLLTPDGHCVIRIPIASSYAWQHYGVNWVQLDAPRHFFLHSVKSMNILADRAGLDVYEVVYDSTALQFWGSEQYSRDIPLHDSRSYLTNPKTAMFSKKEISAFAKRAKALNATKQGDQAIFYLRKMPIR